MTRLSMSRCVAALGVLMLCATAADAEAPKAIAGEAAPAFTLTDHQGNTVTLSDYAGKVVVLEWTNPDCPFVVRHYKAKTMTTLAKTYAERDVVWLAVNSTHYFTDERTTAWAREPTPKTSTPLTTAASEAFSRGTMIPLNPCC